MGQSAPEGVAPAGRHTRAQPIAEGLTAPAMTAGRGPFARASISRGARGHANHGFTRTQAEALARALASAGFAAVRSKILTAGRRTMVVVRGDQAGPAQVSPAQAGPAQAGPAQAG